jgi:serine/threonine-protein phosphatase 5
MSTAVAQAIALKDEGNKAFAAHDWPKAVDLYTKAIELDDKVPAYFSNRAQVLVHLRCNARVTDSE